MMTNTPYGAPDGGYDQGGYSGPQGGYGGPQGGYSAPSPDPNGFGAPMSQAPGGGFYPAAQPVAPKTSRWPLWTCLGCGVLALVILLVLGGCVLIGGLRGGASTGGDRTPTATTAPPTTDPAPSPAPTTDPAPAPTTDPAPAPSGDVLALGATGTLPTSSGGTIDVTVGEPNWDATAEIAEANQFNDPPGPGEVYVTVPVTIVYHGPDKVTPWLETVTTLSSPNGQIYSTSYAVTKEPSILTNDLTDGGTASYTEAFLIPADQVRQGQFIVEPLLGFDGHKLVYAAG